MPTRDSKKKAPQKSAQDLNDSLSTSFRRLDTEKIYLTEQQVADISQQIESRNASKVKDEIRKTKNLNNSKLFSGNSLHGNITSKRAETTPGEENATQDEFESHEFESEQENIAPKKSITGVHPKCHDTMTGASEGKPLRKKKTCSTNQTTRKNQHHPSAEIQQLAQAIGMHERRQKTNFSRTNKMHKAPTATLPVFNGKTEKLDFFEDLFITSVEIYPHLTDGEKVKYIHSLLKTVALQTFDNIHFSRKETIDDVSTAYRRRFLGICKKQMANNDTRPKITKTTRLSR